MLMCALPWNRRWLRPQPHGSRPWLLITGKPTEQVSPWAQAFGTSLLTPTQSKCPLWISCKYVRSKFHSIIVVRDIVGVSEEVFQSMCIFLLKGEKKLSRITKQYTLILDQSCLLCWLQWRWREFTLSLPTSCSYAAWPNWFTSVGWLRMGPSFACLLFVTFTCWEVTISPWLKILWEVPQSPVQDIGSSMSSEVIWRKYSMIGWKKRTIKLHCLNSLNNTEPFFSSCTLWS